MHMKAFVTFVHAGLNGTSRLSVHIVGIFFSKIGIICSLKVKAFGKLSCLIHAGQNLFLCVGLLAENYVLGRM